MTGGLTDEDLHTIKAILERFPEVKEAWLFGSRAKGNYQPGSDIDIALKGENLSHAVTCISGYLNDESPLPYHFDILDYRIVDNQDLLTHIDRVGIKIYTIPKAH